MAKKQAQLLPLTEAVDILGQMDADFPGDEPDRALQVIVARSLDLLRDLGLEPDPGVVVPILGSLPTAALGLLDLLLAATEGSESIRAALEDAVQAQLTQLEGSPPRAQLGTVLERTLVGPVSATARYLPRDVVALNDFRREELLRTWAAQAGMPILGDRGEETAERSARELARLDYRRILADEERFRVERTVVAEHSEKIRQLQAARQRALAASNRE